MHRRTLLNWLVQGAGLLVAGALLVPGVIVAAAPVIARRRRGGGEAWRGVGFLDDFPVGEVRAAAVATRAEDRRERLTEKGVFVWRSSPEEVVVFSRNCTDLSCPVTHDAGSGWFFCPCHGGIFAQDGTPMAGPPSRPLYRFAVRVRGGVVEIDLNSLPPTA